MTTPATGPISMNNVSTEIGGATESMNNFYTLSLGGGLGLGMYHNLLMGPGNNLTYKTAIYDPKSIGSTGENLKLGNFYNYDQTPNMITTFTLTNNNADYLINVNLKIYDPNSATSTAFYNQPALSSGSPITETNYDTLFNITSGSLPNGTYEIHCDVSAQYIGPPLPPPPPFPPTGPGVLNNVTTASDTDGVGAGTFRDPNNIPNFDEFNPLNDVPIVQGNISGTTIFANKRTTFSLEFN
jgi:hypothetical protein